MKLLAILIALFAVATVFVAQRTGDPTLYVLSAASVLCAITIHESRAISSYLKIFAAIFGVEVVIFGPLVLAAKMKLWPAAIASYELPVSLPLTVAIFAVIVYAVSFFPIVRSMTRIADRYFETDERTIGAHLAASRLSRARTRRSHGHGRFSSSSQSGGSRN